MTEPTAEQTKAIDILGIDIEKYWQKCLSKLIPKAKRKWSEGKTLTQIQGLE